MRYNTRYTLISTININCDVEFETAAIITQVQDYIISSYLFTNLPFLSEKDMKFKLCKFYFGDSKLLI